MALPRPRHCRDGPRDGFGVAHEPPVTAQSEILASVCRMQTVANQVVGFYSMIKSFLYFDFVLLKTFICKKSNHVAEL